MLEAYAASGAAYNKGLPAGVPPGWTDATPKGDAPMAAEFKTADAVLLESPTGRQFISFRGTSDLADWKANVGSSYGVSVKYDAAAAIGEHYRNDPDIAYTGHSLGGGLAKLAAADASLGASQGSGVTPKTAIVFNAAPVSPAEYYKHGMGMTLGNEDRVTINVVNKNDVLNRTVAGGDLTAYGGAPIKSREHGVEPGKMPGDEPGVSMIVLAQGSGSVVGRSGHGLGSFVPQTELNGRPEIFAPLSASDGRPLQPQDLDSFYRLPTSDGRSAQILRDASSQTRQTPTQTLPGVGR